MKLSKNALSAIGNTPLIKLSKIIGRFEYTHIIDNCNNYIKIY